MPGPPRSETGAGCRLGVLAFGDSITNGGGELQWGVALQSWALWVARSLGLPYTSYAVDGAQVSDVLEQQLPACRRDDARRRGRFDIGCLYIGVNDVRGLHWDAAGFARRYEVALDFVRARCDRTLALTAPLGLGLPRAGTKVGELNAVIRELAGRSGALVVDLSDFGARNHVMVDRVHPTAFGQIAIAERALAVLAADGLIAPAAPSSLIRYEPTRWHRLRGDWTYVYRDAKTRARAAAIVARVRAPWRRH